MEQLKFIEYSCYPEMKLLGYKQYSINENDLGQNFSYPKDDYNSLSNWIKKYYTLARINDINWLKNIETRERDRNKLYFEEDLIELDEISISNNFLDKRYFDYIRKINGV